MTSRRILLIEYVDATGAAARDVRVRAAALNHAGYRVRSVVVERSHAWGLHVSPSGAAGIDRMHDDAEGRERLSGIRDELRPDTILVASAAPGGGIVGQWVGDAPDARWWPTAIGTRSPRSVDAPGKSAAWTLRALDSGEGTAPALYWSSLEYSRLRRNQLPLWDGEYVLSPAPLAGRSGDTVLSAFNQLCARNDELDFVVLADPQPAFVERARQLGISLRVHFAGMAPRDAEISWLSSASCALMVGDGPLSGGLVLRALACGCPLVPVAGGALADALQPWLEAHSISPGFMASARQLDALVDAVTRHPRLDALIERGRRLASAATIEAMAAQLMNVLDEDVERRHAA